MTIECQCRVISSAQFSRALDVHEARIAVAPDTLRRDAAAVFRLAKTIAAGEQRYVTGARACCGACLPTVEKKIQDRGLHAGEPLDTAPDAAALDDACPFALPLPAPSIGG